MNYNDTYARLIDRARNRTLTGYAERHHVVPRCLGGTDDELNIVLLTAQEHYICHLLLCKIHPGNSKLVAAAMFMTGGPVARHTNKTYAWLRERWSQHMRANNPNAGGKSRRAYVARHGHAPIKSRSGLTEEGRDALAAKMVGEKNPCSGIRPWKHPRATEYSKSVWARADVLYELWKNNDKPSYGRLYMLDRGECYTSSSGVIGPYTNLVKYFRNGWKPTDDEEWNGRNATQR